MDPAPTIVRTAPALDAPTRADPATAYLASLNSPNSRRAMVHALRRALAAVDIDADPRAFPWHELTPAHAQAMRAAIVGSDLAPSTRNLVLSAARGVLTASFDLGRIDADTERRLKRALRGQRARSNVKAGRYVTPAERRAMIRTATAGKTDKAARDGAVLALLAVGLRRAEVAGLDREQYDGAAGTVTVKGKGGTTRRVPLPEGAADRLAQWCAVRGDDPGPLFVGCDRAGAVSTPHRRITPTTVARIVAAAAKLASVRAVTCHDWRRSFVSDALDAGDVVIAAEFVGHADTRTTAGASGRCAASRLRSRTWRRDYTAWAARSRARSAAEWV